jgi:hypothetical protein
MANENKPQPGDAGTGARVGTAGESGPGRDGSAERSGAREESTSDEPRRDQGDTRPPRRR